LIEIVAIKKIAFERLDYCVDLPFGSIFVGEKVLDTVPVHRVVELAALTFVEKFTVLLAHVLFILSAVFDLHLPLLSLSWKLDDSHGEETTFDTNIIGSLRNDKYNLAK